MSINELHDYFQMMVYFIVIVMALFCFGGFCFVGCLKLKQYCYGVWRTVPKSSLAVMLIFAGIATIHAQKRPIYVNAAVEQSGDGTEASPFKELQAAIDSVKSETNINRIVVMPGVYGRLAITNFPVSIVASTNSGERIIDAGGADWGVFCNTIGKGGSSLTGFSVVNATNGLCGLEVIRCGIGGIAELAVSNCLVESTLISGSKMGATESRLSSVTVENCDVGVRSAIIQKTMIANCKAGAVLSVLSNCTVVGCSDCAIADSQVVCSFVTNNPCCAVSNSFVDTCLVADNQCGLLDSSVYGSTIARNGEGGLLGCSVACNSIIAYNKDGQNRWLNCDDGVLMTNCCTSPLPLGGTKNVLCGVPIHPRTLRLRVLSPAIGAGDTNLVLSKTDLDGSRRLNQGAVDLGAFNYRAAKGENCTSKTPIPVPYDWLKVKLKASYNDVKGKGIITEFEDNGSYVRFNYNRYYNGILHILEYASIRCETMANYTTCKHLCDGSVTTWWQEYLMGTDPNNSNDVFIVNISMTNDTPYVSWKPDLGDERLYLIMGTRTLAEEWELVDDMETTDCKFFKVGVELP